MRLDTLPEDLAGLTIEPRRSTFTCFDAIDGPPRPGLLDDLLRSELLRGEGTPAWRAWVLAAAKRRNLSPT